MYLKKYLFGILQNETYFWLSILFQKFLNNQNTMRKILLLSLGFAPALLFAQKNNIVGSSLVKTSNIQKAKPSSAAFMQATDNCTSNGSAKSNKPGHAKITSAVGTVIGHSYYDLQSNASVQRRVNRYAGGKTSATWTFAPVADSGSSTFPARGTGYNYFNGTSWNAIPTARQEASTRTGWPALVVNKNNEEVIITHTNVSGTIYANHKLKNTAVGNTTWTENNITTNATDIWVRTAASHDANHDMIYMIDASQDTNYVKSGCTTKQPMLYSRSTDGGVTWSTDHILIPGFPCNRYYRNGGDDYFIDAKDSIVAIVVAGTGRDITLFKSTDWGVTFSSLAVQSFPIAAYHGGATGSITDSIESNDGNVTCLIDNWGKVHVWWGSYWLKGNPQSSSSWSFYPKLSALVDWNEEAQPARDLDNILFTLHDCDNNGAFDLGTGYDVGTASAQDAIYRSGMVSMPQAGIDASGNIYVTYSELIENDTTGISNSMNTIAGQNYRDLFMMYLKPDVAAQSYDSAFAVHSANYTWSFPVNITKTPGFEDVFPSMSRDVDSKAYITWQEDIEPGTNLINGDPGGLNYIKYMELDITQFQTDATTGSNVCQTTTLTAPVAQFDTASAGCTWHFTDQSTPSALAWSWVFPSDATPQTSTQPNPSVVFSNGGNHIIKLDVYNQAGTTHSQRTIKVNGSGCVNGIETVLNEHAVNIYPNPTTGSINISFNNLDANNASIQIENMLGQQVANLQNQTIHSGSNFSFNLQNQTAGVYLVKIKTEKGSLTQKLVIEK